VNAQRLWGLVAEKEKSAPEGGAWTAAAFFRCSDQQIGGVAVGHVITAQIDADPGSLLRFTTAGADAELNGEITGDTGADVRRPEAPIGIGLLGRGESGDAQRGSGAGLLLWCSRTCGVAAGGLERVGIRHGGFSQRTHHRGPRNEEPRGEEMRLFDGVNRGWTGAPVVEEKTYTGNGSWGHGAQEGRERHMSLLGGMRRLRIAGAMRAARNQARARAAGAGAQQHRQACPGDGPGSGLWRGRTNAFSIEART